MGNLLGEPFKDYVNDQIRARQTVHGKTSRTTEEISYLNSKNAWIKLASGTYMEQGRLDLLNKNGNPMLDGVTPGSDLAIKNVLFNGLTSFKGKNHNRSQRAGIGTNGAYGVGGTSQHGFSPMPGIISADIKDLNRGSIKKASINIKAHNRNQFDVIDALYLRLGFSIMLEWGVDKYLEGLDSNGNGNVKNMGTTLTDKKFFDWSESSYNTVLPAIEKMREKYNGNYDGMFGVISNFSWTFEADGTYNIKLDIISQGDIIESLKANLPPNAKGEASESAYQTARLEGLESKASTDKESLFKLYPTLEDIIDAWWGNFGFGLRSYMDVVSHSDRIQPLFVTKPFPNFDVSKYTNPNPLNVVNIKSSSTKSAVALAVNAALQKVWRKPNIKLPDGSTVNIDESSIKLSGRTSSYDRLGESLTTVLFGISGYNKNGKDTQGREVPIPRNPPQSVNDTDIFPPSSYTAGYKLITNNITLNEFKDEFYIQMNQFKLAGGSEDPQFKGDTPPSTEETQADSIVNPVTGKTNVQLARELGLTIQEYKSQINEEKKEKITYDKGLKENKGKNKVFAYFYKIRNIPQPPNLRSVTALGEKIGVILPSQALAPRPEYLAFLDDEEYLAEAEVARIEKLETPFTGVIRDLRILPVEVDKEGVIQFELGNTYTVEVKFYNLQGKIINQVVWSNLPKGPQGQKLPSFVFEFPPGIYLATATVGDETVVTKFIKNKN